MNTYKPLWLVLVVLALTNCSSDDSSGTNTETQRVDITDAVFTNNSGDCSTFAERYFSLVEDIQNTVNFEGNVEVTDSESSCTIAVNGIPNHDFNDQSARFATPVREVERIFTVMKTPESAPQATSLSQGFYDAIMLNGVVVDMLSAGCYRPDDQMADASGNVAIGCTVNDAWLIDPLGVESRFGADANNAHTQPDGTYHYHGNPNAMFDDNPGDQGSPVIGFAADGFPVFGSYFFDEQTNTVRKAISGYTLRNGNRPGPDSSDPGGVYDGTYIDDYEFTDAGDLDACNGMTVNGQYGYYITDSYPWMIACHSGTVNNSFSKGMFKTNFEHAHGDHTHEH
ncbi:MAG: YHYH protein [Bacteroidota bacterium]